MLSKKMAFSLTSLITILALAFVVSSAMADIVVAPALGAHAHFAVELSYDEAENVDGRQVDITITFDQVVSLADVQGELITVTVVTDNFESTDYIVTGDTAAGAAFVVPVDFDPEDTLPTSRIAGFGPVMQKDIDLSTADGQYDGQTFTFTIPEDVLPRAGLDGVGRGRGKCEQNLCVYSARCSHA